MLDASAIKKQIHIADVISAFIPLKNIGGRMMCVCPFHDDKNPSLVIHQQRFRCFGCEANGDVIEFVTKLQGCTVPEALQIIVDKLSLNSSNLQVEKKEPEKVATYEYVDDSGKPLAYVERWEPGRNGRTKDFSQYGVGQRDMNGVRRVLYRLPQVLASDVVLCVEGEKCVHALESLGFVATTKLGGSGSPWLPDYTDTLIGKRVIIMPDADVPGAKAGLVAYEALKDAASECFIVDMPHGFNDVADYIAAGHGASDVQALIDKARPKPRGLLSPIEIMERDGVEALLDPSKGEKGIATPWPKLNKVIGGLVGGDLCIVGARPSVGKSTLVAQIGLHAAQNGIPVGIFALEMRARQFLHRYIAFLAGISLPRFRHDEKTADERRRIQEAWALIQELPLYISDTSGRTVNEQISDLKRLGKRTKVELAIVDYLGLMESDERAESKNQEISKITRALKLAAKDDLGIPIVVAAQLKRANESEGRRPGLSDLRDSGSIEQDADMVWFLHRPDARQVQSFGVPIKTDLDVAKQRQGPNAIIPMVFNEDTVRFEEAE
ncbi:MAG: AAA family ATPase [Patescibacteria group bacterium]|nr:AAA family ATPase [Patescibacteria group bacterium]